MNLSHKFKAVIWEYSGSGSWHFISVPKDFAADIKELSGPRKGFGSVRVEVNIGKDTWRTSLFPDSKNSTYVLPIKKPIRDSNNLSDGDETQLQITLV